MTTPNYDEILTLLEAETSKDEIGASNMRSQSFGSRSGLARRMKALAKDKDYRARLFREAMEIVREHRDENENHLLDDGDNEQ